MIGILPKLLMVTVFGGLMSLDRTAIGQFQLSRPIVSASLLGLLMGIPAEGCTIAVILELFSLHSLPVGSQIPYNPLLASLIAVLLVSTGSTSHSSWQILPAAIFFSLPVIPADRLAMILWRRGNWRYVNKAEAYLRLGKLEIVRLLHIYTTVLSGLYAAGAILICGGILTFVFTYALITWPGMAELLSIAGMMPFFLGLGGLTSTRVRGGNWITFTAGIAAGLVVGAGGFL